MFIQRIYFILAGLIAFPFFAYAETPMPSPVNIAIFGTIQGNLICTQDCGNCCTSTMISQSTDISYAIGSSSVELENYFNDPNSHWVRGYFYPSSGSCDMGNCRFLHVTAVDPKDQPSYNPQTQKLELPSVSVDGKYYTATVAGPHAVTQATEIVSQSGDCSQGQSCAEGYQCVSYSGISGDLFKNCEISCINNQYCPDGLACINIADGPQNVCQ